VLEQTKFRHSTHARQECLKHWTQDPVSTRDLPSLDLLKGFEAAARLLSFTKAGAELFLTQSAISRQVQALEDQLGVKLFHRRTRSLHLTDEGQRYFHVVRSALDELRAATASLRDRGSSAGLTVTTTATFASLWLVPRLAAFQTAHPEVQVRLVAENRIQDLTREGIDVAVRYCPPGMAGREAIRLFGVRVLPVASPKLAARAKLVRPEDLARVVLIEVDNAESTPWLSWRVWFETMKVPMPTPAGFVRLSQADQVVQAAVVGQGVALGSVPLVDELLRTRQLVAPFGQKRPAPAESRAYYIVMGAHAIERPAARAFVTWLRSTVASAPA
jgi:LysR family transcriptional regulator, glycine cleavage system transcriptional activator